MHLLTNLPVRKERNKSERRFILRLRCVKTTDRLTAVHVSSVGQRLRLPPEVNGFLLLLLQDQTAQVGLYLESPKTEEMQSCLTSRFKLCGTITKSAYDWVQHVGGDQVLADRPSPVPAPAAFWLPLSDLQTRLPLAAPSSFSTRSL